MSAAGSDGTSGAARTMWTLFEPVHAVTYFTAEARAAFEQAGVRGFWRGYFAGRAAPLGTAGAAVVTASFHNFAPAVVGRAIPGVWELVAPEQALRARADGAAAALRRVLAGLDAEVEAAGNLLRAAAGELDCSGRVLAAANAALGAGTGLGADEAIRGLWQAATLLREHRGDGHFAALVAADIDGCEANVLRSAIDLPREQMQARTGWTDEQWEAGRARLTDRGLLNGDGEVTSAGLDTYAAVEAATDEAAERPWRHLGSAATADLRQVLLPIAQACAAAMPPHPLGLPVPR
jgi:hypothetical protein